MATRKANGKGGDFPTLFERIAQNVDLAVQGKTDAVRLALTCLIAEGHLLIEDVPGVGKTLLAKAIAMSIGVEWRRIQFTPDLLPSDVLGASVFDQRTREFTFKPGAVFANIVLGDEINRASPKTQSALLEAMEERQVSVDGQTYLVPDPFLVMATQNPIEHDGTYDLPFAQLDRFLMRISIGYPDHTAEVEILQRHGTSNALADLGPVVDVRAVRSLIAAAKKVRAADPIMSYIATLVQASRDTTDLSLGASPRAGLALLRAARVAAAVEGRAFVTPDDVKQIAEPVLVHRLLLSPEAEIAGRSVGGVVDDLLDRVPVPVRV